MADPIQPEYVDLLNALARGIDQILNQAPQGEKSEQNVAFCLLVFPFEGNPASRVNYISNAPRPAMMAALKEFIARTESRYHPGGRA